MANVKKGNLASCAIKRKWRLGGRHFYWWSVPVFSRLPALVIATLLQIDGV